MSNPLLWVIIGVLLTVATILSNIVFKSGHLSARVEELERWRGTIRQDMHEISDRMGEMRTEVTELSGNIKALVTLIEERTDRRLYKRSENESDPNKRPG